MLNFCDVPDAADSDVFRLGTPDSFIAMSVTGGMLLGWHHHGQPLVRSALPSVMTCTQPVDSAGFPLVPYSNRIADGQFCWDGQPVRIRKNFAPEPHAIHGVGWRARWRLDAIGRDSAVMSMHHAANADWPWPFVARQRIVLTGGVLSLELEARNLADHAVPLGFGHHPYFDAQGATLRFGAQTVWRNSALHLPDQRDPPRGDFDFADGGLVAGRRIDNCYEGWDGVADIGWDGLPWRLALSATAGLPCAIVYIPQGEAYFCFEPVPHANNALNLPNASPVPVIAAGACFNATIRMAAHPARAPD
ncbi:aldose 1-epimerase [Novosphingobium sp.]|uniref:aldose 1-epimerase n=1 Tax=Novosphingobium sp. TaxID=1874826 RepID=UPI003D0D1C77